MKIAYLFLAHNNPNLIQKAIHQLSGPDCGFWIHVDAKSQLGDFSPLRASSARFTKIRVPVFWGEFSQVEGMLALIREAMAAREPYDYFVLLSGSHYPLRSGAYIHHYFETHRGTEFMTLVQMPNAQAGKPLSRLTTLRFPSSRPWLRLGFRLLGRLHLATRDYQKSFGGLKPFSGSTWWALSRGACQHLLDFHERNHRLADFYTNSFAADESYFHTILGNSPFLQHMRRNLVYEDWSGQNGHPVMLGDRHLAFFESRREVCVEDHHGPGEMLFARKFADENPELLARIDALIQVKDQPVAAVS